MDEKTIKRFWSKVDKSGDCWIWTSWLRRGYGTFTIYWKKIPAHRLSYELIKGPIPAGMVACHKCDNRACVNPDHIFIGTQGDNVRDCVRKGRNRNQCSDKTHCVHGHPLSHPNIYLQGTKRRCKACISVYGKNKRAQATALRNQLKNQLVLEIN